MIYIWTPHDWLNKFYSFYMAVVVVLLVGVALELMCIIETNLIRLRYMVVYLLSLKKSFK